MTSMPMGTYIGGVVALLGERALILPHQNGDTFDPDFVVAQFNSRTLKLGNRGAFNGLLGYGWTYFYRTDFEIDEEEPDEVDPTKVNWEDNRSVPGYATGPSLHMMGYRRD